MSSTQRNQRKVTACFGGLQSFERYHVVNFVILAAALVIAFWFKPFDLKMTLAASLMAIFDLPAVLIIGTYVLIQNGMSPLNHWDSISAAWLALGVFGGHYLASVLHNAAHLNFKPNLLNRFLGEASGFLLTYGYMTFRTVHRLHHAYTDEDLDPHSPRGQTLVHFMLHVRKQIFDQLQRAYFIANGSKSAVVQNRWRWMKILIVTNRILRLNLLIVLFGQTHFILFAMPCYLINFLVFTYYNYVMHMNDAGETELRNLDSSFYQKVINRTCHGVLYHRNHHGDLRSFDPRKLRVGRDSC